MPPIAVVVFFAGFGRYQRLLFLLAVTQGLLGVTLGRQPFPVCDTRCCAVLPSCSAALRVTCNCTGADSMTLRRGDVPRSVLAINIWNAKNVVIHEDAVNDLRRLTNFSLRGINQVEIRENGMAFDQPSKIRSVKFENINELHIRSNAFSGVWETRTSISISRVIKLHVESKAFGYRSTTLGPSLTVKRVGMFQLDAKGLVAPLYYLTLDNVVMNKCLRQSFGGKIKRIELNKVTIDEAEARCFSDLDFLSTFSIQSSKINTVHSQAFSGGIRELSIRSSNFTSLEERGINIRTRNLKISHSHIRDLNTNGFSVNAQVSITLEHIRVDSLRKNALAGLTIQRSRDGYTQPLSIRNLDVLSAEEGSLVFPNCAEIRMSDLVLVAPWPRVCPTEQWARQLTGAAPTGLLTPAQFEVFMQLFDRHLCSEDTRRRFPRSKRDPQCDVELPETGERFVEDEEASSVEYDYEEGEESRDAASQHDDWGDEKVDTAYGDAGAEILINLVRSETDVRIDSTAASPGAAAEIAAPSALDRTTPPHETDGGRPGPVEELSVEQSADDHEKKANTSHGEGIEADTSRGSETEETVDAAREARSPSDDSIHPTEPLAGAIGQPALEDGVAAAAPSSGQPQLLLYLSLGAVLSLTAVLAVALLLVLLVRHCRDSGPAGDQKSANEWLAAALDRLTSVDCGGERPHIEPVRPARSSVDYHQYETVKQAPLVPLTLAPLPPPTQLTLEYEGSCAGSQMYESLLDR